MLRKTLLVSLVLATSACSPQGDGSSSAPAVTARPEAAAVAAAPVDTAATVVNGPNTLTLKPGHVFACDGRDRAVSTVGWSSSDPAVQGVTILVQAAEGGERKVFAEGGASGTAETGNWVMAGGKFFMVDSGSGKELAKHVVTAYPCQ
ncbi:MAG TPA: hypothetical protein VN205_00500 [Thermomonas sp.]|nr:hypothetical protein [Thermomonas sp.]